MFDFINSGNIDLGTYGSEAQFWIPVGIDEYSAINGLSEAEMITTPLIDAYGNPVYIPTTTVFSLAFSLISMIKAIVYFNFVRIHVGVSITLLETNNPSNIASNSMFIYIYISGLMKKHRTNISYDNYLFY